MGKFMLAAVLALALSSAVLSFAFTPPQVTKIESGYLAQLQRLYNSAGTNCSYNLSGFSRSQFEARIDQLNSRRRTEYRKYNYVPSDYPYCAGYGYGSGSQN
ncbi:MAG: hypothetical protein K8T20_07370 [Planctomycetes bacterium]|nr:hypothetical protein [Planctomycetota bacterium]